MAGRGILNRHYRNWEGPVGSAKRAAIQIELKEKGFVRRRGDRLEEGVTSQDGSKEGQFVSWEKKKKKKRGVPQ